jgi:hypothetical protein
MKKEYQPSAGYDLVILLLKRTTLLEGLVGDIGRMKLVG